MSRGLLSEQRVATRRAEPVRRISAFIIVAALLVGCAPATPIASESSDQVIANAFSERQSDVQVAGSGTVIRILPDDSNDGRHQRFILELASGQTLLVAHNIDVAPRIPVLLEGDAVEFYGVYEFNDEGGVIHWTHHDPDGAHEAGWLKHNGTVYE